jgi:hypothetical protein
MEIAMASTPSAAAGSFRIAGDTTVHRLGFGAMHITGPGIWGAPEHRPEAKDYSAVDYTHDRIRGLEREVAQLKDEISGLASLREPPTAGPNQERQPAKSE